MPKQSKSSPIAIIAVLCVGLFMLWFTIAGCRHSSVDNRISNIKYADEKNIRVLLQDSSDNSQIILTGQGVVTSQNYRSIPIISSKKHRIAFRQNKGGIIALRKNLGSYVEIIPEKDSFILYRNKPYRGYFRLETKENGNLRVINALPLEAYLGGVISAEMPASWDNEALKAQTVAARTYSLYIMDRFGKNRSWDVRSSQANQMYNGMSAETVQTWDAINATQGLVLTCPDSDNELGLFPTYYCSVCGGHTENSKYVFGDTYSTLNGVECKYCGKFANKKFFNWSKQKYSKKYIFEMLCQRYPKLVNLEKLKTIEPIRISKYNDFQRVTRFKVIGTNGKTDILGGEDLRLTIDSHGMKLKSAACEIKEKKGQVEFSGGRGFGHGVGLCQYGALGMARDNKKFDEILGHYFPDSQLKRLYN